MADNVTTNAGAGGATFRTDDDGTAHWPYTKLAFGADNTQTIVTSTSTNPLPVALSDTDNAVLDNIQTAVELIDNAISGSEMQVDIVSGNVTNAGTFAVQVDGSALTALQVIDNPVVVDDAAFTPATTSVMMAGFEFDDTTPDSVDEGDAGAARMSARREVYVQLRDAAGNERGLNVDANGDIGVTTALDGAISGSELQVDIVSGNVTNAGTFAVQVDGAALTALQLIDDPVATDDTTTHTAASTKVMGIGAVATPTDTTVDANDIAMPAMSTDRRLHVDAQIVGTDAALDVSAATVTVTGTVTANLGATDNAVLDSIDAATTAIQTAVETLDNAISGSEMQVDIVSGNVTNAGTFAVQVDGAALTSLQLIDDPVFADDAAFTLASSKVTMAGAVRDDTLSTLTAIEGDAVPLRVSSTGALHVTGAGGGTQYNIDDAGGATDTGTLALAIRDDALTTLTPIDGDYVGLRVNSTGALHVTGGGGGTEYNEDDVSANPIVGTATLMERDDALTTVTPIEGDWIGLRGSAEGALWTQDFNSDALLADTNTLAGAVSGSEMQVDVVASLPAGTNAIGKLAANSGVDIGDVDVLSVVPGTAATSLGKAEDAVHSTGDTGVYMLAVRDDALAAHSGTDGDYESLHTTKNGALWTSPAAMNTGGCKYFSSNDLDETEEDVATGACTVYGIYAWNSTAAPIYIQMFNTNTVTMGTTAPAINFIVPGNADSDGAGVVIPIPATGLAFSTALTVGASTTVGTTAAAPAANACGIFICYQD